MAQAQEKPKSPEKVINFSAVMARRKEKKAEWLSVAALKFSEVKSARMMWDYGDKIVIEYEENGEIVNSDSWSLDNFITAFGTESPLFTRASNIPLFKTEVEKAQERIKNESKQYG